MSLSEKQSIQGILTIEVIDAQGQVVETRCVPNLITKAGKELLAKILMGKAEALPSKWAIAVGSGKSEPVPEDTKLGKEVTQVDAVATVPGGREAERIFASVKATLEKLNSAEPQALTEAGIIITTGTTKTLFNRVKFAEVNRGSNMVLNLAWEIFF